MAWTLAGLRRAVLEALDDEIVKGRSFEGWAPVGAVANVVWGDAPPETPPSRWVKVRSGFVLESLDARGQIELTKRRCDTSTCQINHLCARKVADGAPVVKRPMSFRRVFELAFR